MARIGFRERALLGGVAVNGAYNKYSCVCNTRWQQTQQGL
jgi:hypothetical protein